jgi:colanic acid biosynthesis protein WcaH
MGVLTMFTEKDISAKPKILQTHFFEQVVRFAPLICIDFILYNKKRILLGERRYQPAKNWLYVPGGRVFKNELFADAIKRIAWDEMRIEPEGLSFYGIFDHIYDENFFNDTEFNTHRVVVAMCAKLAPGQEVKFDHQHKQESACWMTPKQIIKSDSVHDFVKNYFIQGEPGLMW